ncbi:MAG: hypothetical protein Kow0090_12200 [Myxococcota bacterium]
MNSKILLVAFIAFSLSVVATNCKKGEEEAAESAAKEKSAQQSPHQKEMESPHAKGMEGGEDISAPPANAEKSESGLAWVVLKKGTGEKKPLDSDMVTLNYTARTSDGMMLSTTANAPEPAVVHVAKLMPGWAEGVKMMVEGESRRFWIPASLGFKDKKPPHSIGMLVFDTELVSIVKGPPVPPDVAAIPADAEKAPSGLAWKVLKKGEGTSHPKDADVIKVHYTGWTTDGQMFDTSSASNHPPKFALNSLIPGWREGLKLMVEGEKRRIWIPEELAYKGKPNAPQGMLVFEVELEKIYSVPEPPKDVAAPPKDAKKTPSGLAYKVLKNGSGRTSPKDGDKVTVHYTGWTTNGQMFDSSVARGEPATFPVGGVIPGWTEMLKLMTIGEKVLVWIPENLAYGGKEGPPKGMLVFEIELISTGM